MAVVRQVVIMLGGSEPGNLAPGTWFCRPLIGLNHGPVDDRATSVSVLRPFVMESLLIALIRFY